MKHTLALLAIGASLIFTASAHAQSQFKGNYNLYNGYTEGKFAGYAGYGTVTISKHGKAAYTIFYPLNGASGIGTGQIDKKGVFRLSEGTTGKGQLYGNRVAVGNFKNKDGQGFFSIRKK